MEIAPVIGVVGGLVFFAHLLVGIFSRTKIPDVLVLMVVGVLIGPALGLTNPDKLGQFGPVFTAITLIVILFQGGLELRLESLGKTASISGLLTVVTFLLVMLAGSAVAYFLAGLPLLLSLTLGAALGGTSPAVVLPMLQHLEMKEETRSALVLETGLSDVLCIMVSLALLEAYGMGKINPGFMVGHILSAFVLATFIGCGAGILWSAFLRRIRSVKNSIQTTPAFVLLVFSFAEVLGYSGAIAALAFGITLGNVEEFRMPILRKHLPDRPVGLNEREMVFFSEIVFLLKTFFFIYIGISMRFDDIRFVLLGLLITVLVFLVRIPAVRMAVRGTPLAADAPVIGLMVPKGLATAVIAMIPLQRGIPGSEVISSLAFSVVFFSILISAVMVFVLHRAGPGRIYGRFMDLAVKRFSGKAATSRTR